MGVTRSDTLIVSLNVFKAMAGMIFGDVPDQADMIYA